MSNTVSIDHTKPQRQVKPRLIDGLARKAILRGLAELEQGRLVIEDQGEVFEFGEAAEHAAVIAHITINHPSAYRDLLFGGSIGGGEAYMLGSWSSPNLLNVMRLFALNIDMLNSMDSRRPLLSRVSSRLFHWFNANTRNGSRKNISAHYDLGNDFFNLFLDPSMMYSAAIYSDKDATLEQASRYKLDAICQKLQLKESDHLLEIGTGWGGMALHAARNYGCRVTTTTISREQYEYACAAVREAGLEDRVTLLLEDYRNLQGQYDKLVSIEMIEAVGHEYYESYFRKCSSLLKSDGLMLIQAITIADQRYDYARKSVDFIQRYIFPGGCLPSNEVIARCVSRYTDMMIVGLQDIGLDYARTLADWRQRFMSQLDQVNEMGFDEVFCRMWEFYLCYCEGGFRERAISTAQIVFAKPGARQLAAG